MGCTLHPTPYTLHPTPYTLHPIPAPYPPELSGCALCQLLESYRIAFGFGGSLYFYWRESAPQIFTSLQNFHCFLHNVTSLLHEVIFPPCIRSAVFLACTKSSRTHQVTPLLSTRRLSLAQIHLPRLKSTTSSSCIKSIISREVICPPWCPQGAGDLKRDN